MTAWEASFAAGLLQVALVAAIALGLLGRARRQRTAGRLHLCQLAFLGVALLTAAAIARPFVPAWSLSDAPSPSLSTAPLDGPAGEPDLTKPTGLILSWSQLQSAGAAVWKLSGIRAARTAWPQWRWWVVLPLAAMVFSAAARLCRAAHWLHQIRRTSRPIADEVLTHELKNLQHELAMHKPVVLRESSSLCQAAVIGCRRPIILLPANWPTWTPAERRLVLVHELAHVRQGDVRWRWLAEVVLTLHAWQPFVYWLRRRLILEQELAADRAAAGLCGGPAAYLKTLSSLALRGDIRAERITLAPVLTGLLMRRVDMLRTMDGRSGAPRRAEARWRGAALVACVVLVCGLQLPAAEESPADKPSSPLKDPATAARPLPALKSADEFLRPVGAPLIVPHAQGGLLEVHVRELFRGPFGERVTPELRKGLLEELTSGLEKMVGDAGVAIINSLRDALIQNEVETIAADMHAFLEYRPDAPGEQKHQVGFGARALRVRFTSDAKLPTDDHDVLQFRGMTFVPIPTNINAAPGKPLRMCAAYPDARSLVVVAGEEELPHVFPEQPTELSEQMSRLRMMVGGGVLTLVLPAESLKRNGLDKSDEPGDRAADRLLQHAQAVALGVDFTPDNRLAVRLRCSYRTEAEMQEAGRQFEVLRELAQESLAKVEKILKVVNNEPKEVDGGRTFARELIENCRVQEAVSPTGWADLVIQSSGSHWFEEQ